MKHPSLCMIAACLASVAMAPAFAFQAKVLTVPSAAPVAAPAPAPASMPAAVDAAAPSAPTATGKNGKIAAVTPALTSLTVDAVNAAGKGALAAGKPDSATVLRAQVLLDRAHFGSGEIDGAAGSNLRNAITGYQRKNGIPESGQLDAATWAALNADQTPALATYTLTDADVAGPFTPIPEDMAAKAKLPALGYASALEGLGEKFHASTKLLQKLNPGKDLTKVGEQIVVPNVLDAEPLPKAGKIVVDKSARTLALLDAAGKLIAQFPSSSGTDKDPLPIGTWKVNGVSKNPKFHYNPKLFWDAEAGEKKATIPPGPNNPVGLAWIDLSKPHYGIHGTPVPGSIGKTQSHGCIRLTNWDVMAVTASVGPGTEVLMQE